MVLKLKSLHCDRWAEYLRLWHDNHILHCSCTQKCEAVIRKPSGETTRRIGSDPNLVLYGAGYIMVALILMEKSGAEYRAAYCEAWVFAVCRFCLTLLASGRGLARAVRWTCDRCLKKIAVVAVASQSPSGTDWEAAAFVLDMCAKLDIQLV